MAVKDEIQVSYRISVNNNVNNGVLRSGKVSKNWEKYVYTLCIFLNNLAFGMTSSIFFPTMVDMKYIFNTSMRNISISNTFGSIGYLCGSLFGFLYKKINRQITLIILLLAISLSISLTPFAPNLLILYLCSFVTLLGGGAWNSANNVWLIEIWQKSSPPVLQFSQFMYGLGCILAPLLVKPYLTGESSSNATVSPITTTTTTQSTITPIVISDATDRRSLLKTPFLINGLIQCLIPIVLLVLFFVRRYDYVKPNFKRDKSDDDISYGVDSFDYYSANSETTQVLPNSDASKRDRRLNIVLIAIFLATYTTIELSHFGYCSTYYQYITLHLSASEAAEVFSVMASSFTIGRCFSALIAIKLKPKVMIIYHFLVIFVALIILYMGLKSDRLIWLGNVIIGFGFSAVFPAIFALAEEYVKINDKISTILIFSSASLNLFTPFILGPLLETNSFILLEFEVVFYTSAVLLFGVILFVIKPIQSIT